MRFYFDVLANNGGHFAVESPDVATSDQAFLWLKSNPNVMKYQQIERSDIEPKMLASMRKAAW
jgi:hypothetical protein